MLAALKKIVWMGLCPKCGGQIEYKMTETIPPIEIKECMYCKFIIDNYDQNRDVDEHEIVSGLVLANYGDK